MDTFYGPLSVHINMVWLYSSTIANENMPCISPSKYKPSNPVTQKPSIKSPLQL